MKHIRENLAIALSLGGVFPLTGGMLGMATALLRKCCTDDWGISDDSEGFLDWHSSRCGDDGGNPIHTPVEVVHDKPELS